MLLNIAKEIQPNLVLKHQELLMIKKSQINYKITIN